MKRAQLYTVNQLAKLAGVTPKALHVYDRIGLLKPADRTQTRYRLYGEKELLRLQQILFYKELDFPLKGIRMILDDPNFNLIEALEGHKKMLSAKTLRINILMKTIENTIHSLQNKTMLNLEELYDGLSKEEAAIYRNEAINNYGEEVVAHAEKHLTSLNKTEMRELVARQKELGTALYLAKGLAVDSDKVQELIHQHYINTRKLWGTHDASEKQADAYRGLGQLYLTDERFTSEYGDPEPGFRTFISEAMSIYVQKNLN
jgi:DNA-binding transcriptional MerR regulator